MAIQNIYLDTEILMSYFDDHDKGRTARETIAQVKKMIRSKEIKAIVPQTVLGELMLNSCRDKCNVIKIKELLHELEADFPNANSAEMQCARDLIADDNGYIQPNDALIVAHALMDDNASWLLTNDTKLVGNLAILKKMGETGNQFNIAEKFN